MADDMREGKLGESNHVREWKLGGQTTRETTLVS